MKMLVDEIKKVAGQTPSEPVDEPEGADNEGADTEGADTEGADTEDQWKKEHSKPTEESSDIQFTKEIDLEPNERPKTDEPKTDEPKTDEPKTDEPKTDEPPLVIIEDPYQRPDDPSQSQIEKATP